MSQDNGRKALHAYVSDHAHDQWHGFAAEQGVSVSAILEAMAPELLFHDDSRSDAPLDDCMGNVVQVARRIDAERRRRRR